MIQRTQHPLASLRAALMFVLPFALTLAGSGSVLATPGTLIRATELKAQPFLDASALGQLAAESQVTIMDSKGGWSQIRTTDGKTGWVRLLNIRVAAAPTTSTSSLASLGGVVRTGTSRSTATTGAKGLSREDIAQARPNPAEVQKLDAWRSKPADIDKFAAARKLTARDVADLQP